MGEPLASGAAFCSFRPRRSFGAALGAAGGVSPVWFPGMAGRDGSPVELPDWAGRVSGSGRRRVCVWGCPAVVWGSGSAGGGSRSGSRMAAGRVPEGCSSSFGGEGGSGVRSAACVPASAGCCSALCRR